MSDTLPVFNKAKALELVDNDQELLDMLLETFVETEFSLDHLNSLTAAGKNDEAASYTHRVKGAGRQLAMEKLAASGQALEDVLRGKKTGDIKALTETFWNDYNEGLSVIKKEINH